MITLSGSRFLVKYENYESKVFTMDNKRLTDITSTLTEDEKDELIDDLIYAINDLLNNKKDKTEKALKEMEGNNG